MGDNFAGQQSQPDNPGIPSGRPDSAGQKFMIAGTNQALKGMS